MTRYGIVGCCAALLATAHIPAEAQDQEANGVATVRAARTPVLEPEIQLGRSQDRLNRSSSRVGDRRAGWIGRTADSRNHAHIGAASCDERPFRNAESRRNVGGALALGGVVAGIVGLVQLTTYDGEGSVALPVLLGAGGVVAEVVGLSMMKSTVRPQDLDLAMESIVVGETRMDAVIKCFGRPTTIATDGDTRTATFLARSLGRTYAVTITSRAGIVSGKRKAESGPY